MTSSPAPPPTGEESPAIYSGMEELAAGYEGYILDLWGVIQIGRASCRERV